MVCESIRGHVRVCEAVQGREGHAGFARVCKDIQVRARPCESMRGRARMCDCLLGCAWACEGV